MAKPCIKCPACNTKIYFETNKNRLNFCCKKCGCKIDIEIPLQYQSYFHVAHDPVLIYEDDIPKPQKNAKVTKKPGALTSQKKIASSKNNPKFTYSGPRIAYFKINQSERNSMLQYLQMCYPELLVDCPSLDGAVDYVLKKVFSERINSSYIVTNNSYKRANGHITEKMSIRSVTSNFLESRLYEKGRQLRVSGSLTSSGVYVIDRLDIVRPSPLMSNEVNVDFQVIYDTSKPSGNYLKQLAHNIPTYSEEMQDELALWDQYLDWKQKLAELKIQSVKYIGVRILENEYGPEGIGFCCVVPSPNYFKQFKKILRRESDDLAVFSNNMSKNRWVFSYNNAAKFERPPQLSYWDIDDHVVSDGYWDDTNSYLIVDTPATIRELRQKIRNNPEAFPDPVFFELKFRLPENDLDMYEAEQWTYDEILNHVAKRILKKLGQDGFIATSRIGDFALNARLKHAILDLSEGCSTSGNLGNWIFDIKKARTRTTPIKINDIEWSPWGKEHLNDSQKLAVADMLAAPDVFLCQGPPGTGKTTVIAEVVYQLAIRNKRVLIASQTNLAVNNALSRLLDYPSIRPIRLGADYKIDESVDAISDQKILQTFFTRVRNDVNAKYLIPWEQSDQERNQLQADETNIDTLLSDYQFCESKYGEIQGKISEIKDRIKAVLERNDQDYEQIEQNKSQAIRLSAYAQSLEHFKSPSEAPFLDSKQAQLLYSELRNTISALKNKGFKILPDCTDISRGFEPLFRKETNYLIFDITNFFIFIHNSSSGAVIHSAPVCKELRQLIVDKRELEERDDLVPEEILRLYEIQKKIKMLQAKSQSVIFPEQFVTFLPDKLLQLLSANGCSDDFIKQLCDLTSMEADAGISIILEFCTNQVNALNSSQEQDEQEIHTLRGQLAAFELRSKGASAQIEKLVSSLNSYAAKYATTIPKLKAAIHDRKASIKKDESKIIPRNDFEPFLREFAFHIDSLGDDYSLENSEYLKQFINACNVVGISCTENSNTLTQNGFKTFDVTIIDEVSKATPPELLIPLLLAEKAILVGDHRQLPPLFGEHATTYQDYIEEIDDDDVETKELLSIDNYNKFEELVTNSLFKRHYEQANAANKRPLLKQYRMHREIMDVVNMFYDGRLEAGLSTEDEALLKTHQAVIKSHHGGARLVTPDHHAYWVDSSKLHDRPVYEENSRGYSKQNRLEVAIIANMVQQIDDSYAAAGYTEPIDIGIISFYGAQVKLIRDTLSRNCTLKHVSCDVNTVDRFQGKEKSIVIVSLVRNVKAGKRYDATYVKAYQRINVAVSRAQNLLLLVGAKDMYIDQEIPIENMETGELTETKLVYRDIIEQLHRNGCVITADDILGLEADKEIFNVD